MKRAKNGDSSGDMGVCTFIRHRTTAVQLTGAAMKRGTCMAHESSRAALAEIPSPEAVVELLSDVTDEGATVMDPENPYCGPLLRAARSVLRQIDAVGLGLGEEDRLAYIEALRIVRGANDSFALGCEPPSVAIPDEPMRRNAIGPLTALGAGVVASSKARVLIDTVTRIAEERSQLLGTLRNAVDRNDVEAVFHAATLLTGRG